MEINPSIKVYLILVLLMFFQPITAFAINADEVADISAAKKLYVKAVPMAVDSPERAKILEQSASILKKVISTNPQSLEAHRKLMGVYLLQQDYSKGIRTMQSAINLSPQDPKLFITLAFLYEHSGAFEYSMAMLDQALALDPENSLAKQYQKTIQKKINKNKMQELHDGNNVMGDNHGKVVMDDAQHTKPASMMPHSAAIQGK